MKLLLDDRLAPITSEIGFIEVSHDKAASAYVSWQKSVVPTGVQVSLKRVSQPSLEAALAQLLPLTTIMETRALFVATGAPWTAFFTNSAQGSDVVAPMSFLAKRLGVRALRVAAVPATHQKGQGGRFGATVLEIYGPEDREFLNYVRSIACVNDDGNKWTFVEAGAVQPFEQQEAYVARKVSERFTPEMLARYVAALGLAAFEESFYRASEAMLVEKSSYLVPGLREMSLEDARTTLFHRKVAK